MVKNSETQTSAETENVDRGYAIMVKNPYTGKDCIYSGKYFECNLLPACDINEIKSYSSMISAERDLTIFMKSQNARVVTFEDAEIFLWSCYTL